MERVKEFEGFGGSEVVLVVLVGDDGLERSSFGIL